MKISDNVSAKKTVSRRLDENVKISDNVSLKVISIESVLYGN